jgi:hypothetical protein
MNSTCPTERAWAYEALAARDRRSLTQERSDMPLPNLVPRYGGAMYLPDDGIPAGGRQTAAIIGTCICGVLLLLGLAYLVWAGSHGGYPWAR